MMDSIKKKWPARIAVVIFIIFTTWWIILQFMQLPHESGYNQLWGGLYGIVALWGGIWGVIISQKWGGFRSIIGNSIFFFALGLLFQEVGQIAYTYYISFLNQPIPYPSIGDLFFYSTIILYIIAVIYMAKVTGVHISWHSFHSKLQAVLIPAVILLLSYFFFLKGYEFDWSKPLVVFLDFVVPIGQAIYISLAILIYTLTRNVLGGVLKSSVLLIIIALVVQYIADWTFLYQASQEIWYTGGINDYMYFFAYFLMTIALLQFDSALQKMRGKK